jgi:hypothetical protein
LSAAPDRYSNNPRCSQYSFSERDEHVVAAMLAVHPEDPVRFAGRPESRVVFVSRADYECMVRAYVGLELLGQTGAPMDQLAVARDAHGRVVGYVAEATGFIPKAVVSATNFELEPVS